MSAAADGNMKAVEHVVITPPPRATHTPAHPPHPPKASMMLGWQPKLPTPHTVLCTLVAAQHRNFWDPCESTGASLGSLLTSQANLIKGPFGGVDGLLQCDRGREAPAP